MRTLVIAIIQFYQWVAPSKIRNRCLFRESCSNYVLDGARSVDSGEAFRRMRRRVAACRPGYRQIDTFGLGYDGEGLLQLADGSVLDLGDASDRIRSEFSLPPETAS